MDKTKLTTESQSVGRSQPEPREAALQQVEHDTAEQQERTHRLAEREAHDDARTQAQKFQDAAREHGADQDEEVFKGVLRKLAKPKG